MFWRLAGLVALATHVQSVEVSPILFSGTHDPTLTLTAHQLRTLTAKVGSYQRPGPRNRTVGYRGFRVEGFPVLRGCKDAELFLLDLFRPQLPEEAVRHIEEELSLDHSEELDLPDALEFRGKVNCSHEVGPDTVPAYDPQHDDAGCFVTHQSENNCYNYATDISTDTFAQPGRGTGHKWKANTCAAVRVAAESDGLEWKGTSLPTAAPRTGHYVALFIWPDTNFHWIRMDHAGNWSHKPGGTPVRNTDNKGRKIHDPSKSDFSPWSQFCGYMHVVPSMVKPDRLKEEEELLV